MTHPLFTHPNGDQCVWLDDGVFFVPLDAGGEGHDCPHDHPWAANVWDEAVEATVDWIASNPGPSGIWSDPPRNPYA